MWLQEESASQLKEVVFVHAAEDQLDLRKKGKKNKQNKQRQDSRINKLSYIFFNSLFFFVVSHVFAATEINILKHLTHFSEFCFWL